MQLTNHPTITTNGVLRPTHVEVNLSRITENLQAIQTNVGDSMVMPILKANAYGHGLVEVARHLTSYGVQYLGVAYLEEAILLREAGIEIPILVLGGILGSQVPLFLEHDLTLTASSLEKLQKINDAAEEKGTKAKIHLKIDTGMERIGVHYYSAETLLEASLKYKNLHIEGIFSHFSDSDVRNLESAKLQLERFQEVLRFYEHRSIPAPMRHMANSGAILQFPESYMDIVRPGILLFGVYPSSEVKQSIPVQPALTWKSRVVYFKVVQPNHPVSYGSTWKSDHQVRVVTVPVGYGDGYFRSMSGKAQVIIRGKRYPVVGLVCMDQFMVNIEWETAYNDDEVILVGNSKDESITVEDLSAWAGTIPYEILTNINTRVPRVYKKD
ncbi:MAG: alanine racemase [Chloroflexi bacterium]|nr:alanine racemase [Chloroflexota bacterium]